MNRTLRILIACALSWVAACGDDDTVKDTVKIVLFRASPDAIEAGQSTQLVFAVEPPTAKVTITGLGDLTGQTSAMVNPTADTSYQLTAVNGAAVANAMVKVTVGPTSASAIKVEPATTMPTAGDQLMVTLTVLASNGKPAPGFRGTVHLSSTDSKATLPADLVFTATDAGTKQAMVTLQTAGLSTLTATEITAKAGVQGSASMAVQPAAAKSFQLTALPANATAGQSLVLTITVKDAFGNVVTNYGGQSQVTSTDPTDILPPAGEFISGVRTVSVAFTKAGNHIATVADVAGVVTSTDTSSVAVVAGSAFRVSVATESGSTTAGAAQSLTTTVLDLYDNTVLSYVGTLHFSATDANAALPADFTFTAGDAGTHQFSVTLKTSGRQDVAISDNANGLNGTASWTVSPAAGTNCVASQAPTTAIAGSVVGLTVAVRDPFGNAAIGYSGTIHLTATDARANLPADVTYLPLADAGSHAFSVSLLTTGNQSVIATDTADPTIQCDLGIAITPAAPKLLVTVPDNANAGYAVAVGVTVKDLFDNAIPAYAGTIAFTSSDHGTGAVTPSPITFTGSEGGVSSTSATFVTLGSQTLSAQDSGSPQAAGSAAALVHGLVYSGPSAGRVRLVANSAQSTAAVVQLDLVATERLERTSLFAFTINGVQFIAGPGAFTIGMNLPLDTTRAMGDAVLLTPGPALVFQPPPPTPGGTRPPPISPLSIAKIGDDKVLYTAMSRKRVTSLPVLAQANEVPIGQVLYSVRLKLTQTGTPGAVFDGAQPLANFRASIRDQFGDEFVQQSDIGIGKLEIR